MRHYIFLIGSNSNIWNCSDQKEERLVTDNQSKKIYSTSSSSASSFKKQKGDITLDLTDTDTNTNGTGSKVQKKVIEDLQAAQDKKDESKNNFNALLNQNVRVSNVSQVACIQFLFR
jgi:hypothetical protein